MQTAPAATPAPRGIQSTYRLEHCESRLCIRLHCEPALTGDTPRIVPQLARADRASRFPDHDAAALIAATYLPHLPVEIVRVDS
jgi:hypothetical protein